MVATTLDHFGRLDVLINNAAITFIGDLDIPMHRFDLVMSVNMRAPLLAIRRAVPAMRAAGGGAVVNVSSVAALYPHPSLMAYGMSKVALERLTVDAASQLAADSIAVNCFRIDLAVASEGFIANTPGADHSDWEPSEVAAEGILWMVRQPPSYSGRRESMFALRQREGIMASRVAHPATEAPPVGLANGVVIATGSAFAEPYPDDAPSG
jgi:citronellol/citronellal dehydrogenase